MPSPRTVDAVQAENARLRDEVAQLQKSLVGALAKPTRNVGGGHFKGGPLRKKDEERDEEVETLRRQLQEKRVQVGSLTKRADGLQSSLKQHQDRLEELQLLARAREEESAEARRREAAKVLEAERMKAELHDERARREAAEARAAELERDLAARIEQADRDRAAAAEALAEAHADAERNASDRDAALRSLAALRAELDAARREAGESADATAALRAELDATQKQLADVEADAARAARDFRDQVAGLEAERAAIAEAKAALADELAHALQERTAP